ncbi:MAG: hypothetical protein KIT49_11085 [Nitrospira sp.]|jgi:hypothetical protein|nr:hypothetical protein [Nitrospira sp.]HNG03181.1 hypothetical protein [Nitrospira sp.]HNI19410.1 hypothetical protein [Nitrospira sp.]HNK51293.1 hypothetical protein [Nitrospira sp.]HNM20350.1 hypothetical protein [Nitrospira sp.]
MERAKPKLLNRVSNSRPKRTTSPLPSHIRDEISSILADALLADLQADSRPMAKTHAKYGQKWPLTDNHQSAMTLAGLELQSLEFEKNEDVSEPKE